MCSVPAVELTNRSYTVLPPITSQIKLPILYASCMALHHTLWIRCILATDRSGPSRTAIVAVRIRYYLLSFQFIATRKVTHTMCSDPTVELTNHLYALLSFYLPHQTLLFCLLQGIMPHLPDTLHSRHNPPRTTRMAHCHR